MILLFYLRKILHSVLKYFEQSVFRIIGANLYTQLRFLKCDPYFISFFKKRPSPVQIYNLDGHKYTCGFADRLRGIISIYAWAKANELPFRINHETPFHLEDYLVPNKIDWQLKENELSYNVIYSNPIVMMDYTKGKRLPFLCKKRQHHFYANINALPIINEHYKKNYSYTELFQELFKPSCKVSNALEPYSKYIDEGYISISFRFMQLMGDFVDVCGSTLDECGREKLVKDCMKFVTSLHEKHLDIKYVLVTSDSETFIDIVKKLPFVFVIPGKIGHIGFNSDADATLKMIIDFLMISRAKKAYMGYTGQMYKSHFAESAAEITGIPYESVNF